MAFLRTALRMLAVVVTAGGLLAACGEVEDPTKARVRLVNASAYDALDLRVDGSLRQGSVGYGSQADYADVDPDDAETYITTPGSGTPLLSFTPSLSEKRHYSVLAFGSQGALKQLTLEDETAAPDANKALVRVLNASPDAGPLDVYLTDADDDALSNAVPLQTGAAYGTLGSWITVDSRTWRLRVTAPNNKTDQRLDVPGIVLSSKQITTLVLSSAPGGVLVRGLLLTQQGGIGRADVTQARVRVVAGVANNAHIELNWDGIALMKDVASPAVGFYTLVPAGSKSLELKVNGVAAPATAPQLAAGADYTFLVHGPATAAQFSPIPDLNLVPTDTSQARIRLVNGVSGLSGPLSLTVEHSPIGSGVPAGQASGYQALPAAADTQFAVTGLEGVVYSDNDRALLPGSTYSVFVLGAKQNVTGLLRKDR